MVLKRYCKKDINAFTLIELIITIVIIGALAAITVVSYFGIRESVLSSSLKNDLSLARGQLELDRTENGAYPLSDALADSGNGLKKSGDTLFSYSLANGGTYCLTASSVSNSSLMFHVQSQQSANVLSGPCQDKFKSIDGFGDHFCTISIDDNPYCWGYNPYGQVGDGTTVIVNAPKLVSKGDMPSNKVKQLVTGANHTCAIAMDDHAYCWGRNSYGRLGDGTTVDKLTPVAVAKGAMPSLVVKQISLGEYSTCAIAENNQAYCWGRNNYGQIGDNTTSSRYTPTAVLIGSRPSLSVKNIYTGDSFNCVISLSNSNPYCWGENGSGQLGDGTKVSKYIPTTVIPGAMTTMVTKQMSLGSSHVCAISNDDKAYCWGENGYYQIGDNTTTDKTSPTAILQGAMPSMTVKQIEVGHEHSCAIADDDHMYCWGMNYDGTLGDNTSKDSGVPVAVLQGDMVSQEMSFMALGDNTSCALSMLGKAYCWGVGVNGDLGNGHTTSASTPYRVDIGARSDSTIDQISTGIASACVLSNNQRLYCWGRNDDGQIGDGTNVSRSSPVAVSQGAMPSYIVKQISVGEYHTCAIASDDKPYCWGRGLSGQLGDGTYISKNVPVAVSQGAMPAAKTVKFISAGGYHTCVIGMDNNTYCWGDGNEGQLGNNSTSDRTTPVAVAVGSMLTTNVKQLTTGFQHTCVVGNDDKAYCWGENLEGELGNNSTTRSSVPVAVSQGAMLVTTIKQISNFGYGTCAVTTDDRPFCWGDNTNGELGNNTYTASLIPVAVSQGDMTTQAVKTISANGYHVCAIGMDDKMYCWGNGNNGEVGDGYHFDRSVPTAVLKGNMPSTLVSKIATGPRESYAVASDGYLYSWGSNTYGQIGISKYSGLNYHIPSLLAYPVGN